ncbi:unnamed protein product [Prunus brigantina]
MGGSVKDVQFKELDSVVWPSRCEASKHMDEVKVARVDGLVKAGEPASAPTSLETVQELAKETGSSDEQIQAQNGLDDALKRRLQKLIDSNQVMLFMKGTPEEPKCEFSRMAVNFLNDYEVKFGSFDLLTDNEVMEGIRKYSNRPQLPYIYFDGSACDLHHRHNHLPCALNLIHSTLPFAEVDSLIKMQNEEGVITELYIPRKCSATNRLITSKDHASVQINVGHLDENGIYTGQFSTFALCGYVRAQGDADSGLDRLWQKKKAEVKQH